MLAIVVVGEVILFVRTWKIHTIEDFSIDGKDEGPELGIWKLDLRSQFPVLFVHFKETKTIVPHSETVEKCSGCAGRGDRACPTCNSDQEPRFYKENQMTSYPSCHGRGLIAHQTDLTPYVRSALAKGRFPVQHVDPVDSSNARHVKGAGHFSLGMLFVGKRSQLERYARWQEQLWFRTRFTTGQGGATLQRTGIPVYPGILCQLVLPQQDLF